MSSNTERSKTFRNANKNGSTTNNLVMHGQYLSIVHPHFYMTHVIPSVACPLLLSMC
jgi:hypothetical protein